MNREDLEKLLDTFELPEKRKDLSKQENISWLLRNIWIRNQNNTALTFVIEQLKNYIQ